MSYGFVSIDVHGASGMDHFVHRFTHRVARGLMLAVGRPDGRLCCLAKTEAATLLATKQAVFIQNPEYIGGGSGPDVVTIGHNPFAPNLGYVVENIVLPSHTRAMFVDEVLYDRLYAADFHFATHILRSISYCRIHYDEIPSFLVKSKNDLFQEIIKYGRHVLGVHHIDPAIAKLNLFEELVISAMKNKKAIKRASLKSLQGPDDANLISAAVALKKRPSVFSSFTSIKSRNHSTAASKEIKKTKSDNPFDRLSFMSLLDSRTLDVLDSQVYVQQFYECRIASLERYLSFCVIFHAMAKSCCNPLLCHGWDIARSQSNLRVATTASPVTASGDEHKTLSAEQMQYVRKVGKVIRGFKVNF